MSVEVCCVNHCASVEHLLTVKKLAINAKPLKTTEFRWIEIISFTILSNQKVLIIIYTAYMEN